MEMIREAARRLYRTEYVGWREIWSLCRCRGRAVWRATRM